LIQPLAYFLMLDEVPALGWREVDVDRLDESLVVSR
jgi:hypothetical protein